MERVDDLLVNGLRLIQDDECFCFGCDGVEIANFVTGGAKDKAVDLGCGTGIITVLLAGKKNIPCVGIELQPRLAALALRNVELNGLDEKASVINARMQDACDYIEAGSKSIVVCNPPYRRAGSGEAQSVSAVAIARHEVAVTLSEVVAVADKLLKNGGSFYIVHQCERMAEVLSECSAHKLEPKILQVLTPNEKKEPHLFMLKAVKHGKIGLRVLPQRAVRTEV